ncbi:hypothetical protein AGOR_G00030610 [Albula goreensis]|uniref:Ig-like domain-containing protein n=1 Tax=Albula goreensis TaxID=1534307 RepID=A0A8T3E7Y3_9TELE|nr:hypothetical protein AGOR_G00030610 [Albula goreensis]
MKMDQGTFDVGCCFIGLILLFAPPSVSSASVYRKSACLGQSIPLPCNGAARSGAELFFMQHGEQKTFQKVAEMTSGRVSAEPEFEGRLKSDPMEQPGSYGLILGPLVYNDGGSYECRPKNSTAARVETIVDILFPFQVSMAMGEPAILPCVGNIKKQAHHGDLCVQWTRDGMVICKYCNNTLTCSPEFKNRASLSTDHILQGNMSLTIKPTRSSDRGYYQCSYNEEKGNPAIVSLTVAAHPPLRLTVKEGDSLPVPLYTTEPLNVMFSTAAGSDEVLVASVKKGSVLFRSRHLGRVLSNTVVLQSVTLLDSGVYSITENDTGEAIGTVFVQVTGSCVSAGTVAGITLLVAVVAAAISIFISHMCLKKSFQWAEVGQ